MNLLFAAVGRASQALAWLTMILIGFLVVLVTADVVVRSVGLRPLAWAPSTAEYLLLYACFLPMPALVRGKGHVFVEFLRAAMPGTLKRICEVAVYLTCIAICAYLGWVAFDQALVSWREGSYETRTFDMPKWLVYAPMVLGFWLSVIEWLRYLMGHDSLYDIDPLSMEGY